MNPALELRHVRKAFGATIAVDGLDLVVPRGALYGFIGPSGAGKTTCIRMIMSILFPDSGSLSVLGHASALAAKDRIGYLPEERGVYRHMRVGAFLVYVARLKGLGSAEASARVPRLLDRVGLAATADRRCEDLSKGMLQRVQFVAAILHEPELIILDEPFAGLDPVTVRLLHGAILEQHQRGATVLLSTHVMAHAEAICEHVVMIHRGRKVLDEPMTRLRRQFDLRTVRFEPLDPAADVSALRRLPQVDAIEQIDGGYEIRLAEGTDPAGSIQHIAAAVPPARIELARLRLEDVFVDIVTAERREPDTAQALRAGLQASDAEGAAL